MLVSAEDELTEQIDHTVYINHSVRQDNNSIHIRILYRLGLTMPYRNQHYWGDLFILLPYIHQILSIPKMCWTNTIHVLYPWCITSTSKIGSNWRKQSSREYPNDCYHNHQLHKSESFFVHKVDFKWNYTYTEFRQSNTITFILPAVYTYLHINTIESQVKSMSWVWRNGNYGIYCLYTNIIHYDSYCFIKNE